MSSSVWFNVRNYRPAAQVRLICLPWSGGGSQWYANWGSLAPANVEVVGVTFPGRESRFREPPVRSLAQLTADIAAEIDAHLSDKPVAFFGHSMGIATSFEVALHLKKTGKVSPVHMFFSGMFAPHSSRRTGRLKERNGEKWHLLDDSTLVKLVRSFGGIPEAILSDRDFMKDIFLPPFRKDLALMEGYRHNLHQGAPPLSCPVTVMNGSEDMDFKPEEFAEVTTGSCHQETYPGGHFYLFHPENSRMMMEMIGKQLTEILQQS